MEIWQDIVISRMEYLLPWVKFSSNEGALFDNFWESYFHLRRKKKMNVRANYYLNLDSSTKMYLYRSIAEGWMICKMFCVLGVSRSKLTQLKSICWGPRSAWSKRFHSDADSSCGLILFFLFFFFCNLNSVSWFGGRFTTFTLAGR